MGVRARWARFGAAPKAARRKCAPLRVIRSVSARETAAGDRAHRRPAIAVPSPARMDASDISASIDFVLDPRTLDQRRRAR